MCAEPYRRAGREPRLVGVSRPPSYEEFGVSTREYDALAVLAGGAGVAGQQVRAVARAIGLSPSATSRLLSRLRDRDLIAVQVGHRDHRTLDIQLTPAAHEVVRRGPAALERITTAAIAALSAADHDPVLVEWLRTDRP
ncbi:MarR family winged helix-turn-helix transcriptional regulator [Streptomyces sp. NPDC059224]|uniref:MarR family winged helix-turn-helix transcriptional regulator n=1 Tax=Streptomyces sp. NPDC059224 TaxID=3346775 RepID=UPI0036BA00F7